MTSSISNRPNKYDDEIIFHDFSNLISILYRIHKLIYSSENICIVYNKS
jgi:hypothetical protein